MGRNSVEEVGATGDRGYVYVREEVWGGCVRICTHTCIYMYLVQARNIHVDQPRRDQRPQDGAQHRGREEAGARGGGVEGERRDAEGGADEGVGAGEAPEHLIIGVCGAVWCMDVGMNVVVGMGGSVRPILIYI